MPAKYNNIMPTNCNLDGKLIIIIIIIKIYRETKTMHLFGKDVSLYMSDVNNLNTTSKLNIAMFPF